jgi:hypothetical protein
VAADQWLEQTVAADAGPKVGEVVVDANREAHPLDRKLEVLGCRRLGRLWSPEQPATVDPSRVEGVGTDDDESALGLPSADDDRALAHVQEPPKHPAAIGGGAVAAASARQLEGPGRRDLNRQRPGAAEV